MEEWRVVPGLNLEASSLGRLRSKAGLIRKTQSSATGYRMISVWMPSERRYRNKRVHRLVFAAFCGEVPAGKQINHIDGDKANNQISNLEAVTQSENIRHGIATGLYRPGRCVVWRGGHHWNAKLDEEKVRQIMASDASPAALGRAFGVERSVISRIKGGHSWKHITAAYSLDAHQGSAPSNTIPTAHKSSSEGTP